MRGAEYGELLMNKKGSLFNYTPGFQKPGYEIHIHASGSSQESHGLTLLD